VSDALRHFEQALTLDPTHVKYLVSTANMMIKLRPPNVEGAIGLYQRAQALDLTQEQSELVAAKLRYAATVVTSHNTRFSSTDWHAKQAFKAGLIANEAGNVSDALRHFEQALTLDPTHVKYLVSTANMMIKLRPPNVEGAIGLYQRAQALDLTQEQSELVAAKLRYANQLHMDEATSASKARRGNKANGPLDFLGFLDFSGLFTCLSNRKAEPHFEPGDMPPA